MRSLIGPHLDSASSFGPTYAWNTKQSGSSSARPWRLRAGALDLQGEARGSWAFQPRSETASGGHNYSTLVSTSCVLVTSVFKIKSDNFPTKLGALELANYSTTFFSSICLKLPSGRNLLPDYKYWRYRTKRLRLNFTCSSEGKMAPDSLIVQEL